MTVLSFANSTIPEQLQVYDEIYRMCNKKRINVTLMVVTSPQSNVRVKTEYNRDIVYILHGNANKTFGSKKDIKNYCNFKKGVLCLKLRRQSEGN